jgi:hypothetical protein
MTDDVRKLLGGYATGTLTEEEKQKLFDAALNDSALFEALADEQALKELLDDPAVRAQVLQATETHVFSVTALLREWFESPKSKALVATGAVLVIAIAITTIRDQQRTRVPQMARSSQPAIAPAAPSAENKAEYRTAVPSTPSTKPRAARPASSRTTASAQVEKREAAANAAPKLEADLQAAKGESQRAEPVFVSATAAAVASSFLDQQPARSVPAGTGRLKYVLLKRSATGEYIPAAVNSELAANEEARLAVEATEAGTISLARDDSTSLTTTVVEANRPATFSLPASTRSATLFFIPASAPVVDSTLVPALRSQMRAKQAAAAPAAAQDQQTAAPARVQVEIKLNRK